LPGGLSATLAATAMSRKRRPFGLHILVTGIVRSESEFKGGPPKRGGGSPKKRKLPLPFLLRLYLEKKIDKNVKNRPFSAKLIKVPKTSDL
jgi:hypothetical protein